MNQYEQIMSVESVLPFIIGYSIHGIFAGIHAGIALVLLTSSLLNIFSRRTDIFGLRYIGFSNNISGHRRKLFGISQLAVATLLALPLFIDIPFWTAQLSFSCLAFTIIIYQRLPKLSADNSGKISRYGILFFSLLALVFVQYEKTTPLGAIKIIANDVMHYRPLEQAWQDKFDIQAPKIGQQATEFTLLNSNGKTTSKLSDFIGKKPVVLFIGANSCPVFSAGMNEINSLYKNYSDKVNFVGVYVSEPHATDEWPLARTRLLEASKDYVSHPVAIDIKQPTEYQHREWAANRLKENLLHKDIPLLVDGMDNAVNNKWVGRPARIYVIGTNGKIIYNPGKGPYSFNPSYLEPVLNAYLDNDSPLIVKSQ